MPDFRFALRRLVKSPGFTAIAALSIAVGIGANAIVFTWIRGTLLNAIPGVSQPGELAVVCPRHVSGEVNDTMSIADIASLAAETNLFRGITASQMGTATLRVGDSSEWVWGQMTLANFFEVLGVRPELGRGFEAGEDRAGAAGDVVVISHGLWQRRFGGDPSVVGRKVEINQRPVTIVGVAPRGFQGTVGGLKFEVWVPLPVQVEPDDLRRREETRGWRWLHTVARLAPEASFSTAKVATSAIGDRLSRDYPKESQDVTLALLRVWESPWGGQALFLPLLQALSGVALLLLALVVANVANLLLARAQNRRTEMALRLALGAARGQLIRQLLVESLLLAAVGGVLGVLLSWWGARSLTALMPPTYLPLGIEFALEWSVVAAASGLTLLAGIGFGIVPAWQAARTDLNATLKAGSRAAAGGERTPLRAAFVIGQLALALTLLVGMGLCIRSFGGAQRMDLGLDPKGVFVAGFRLSPRWGDDAAAHGFYRRLQSEVATLPGVESVAFADWLPLGFEGGSGGKIEVPGYLPKPGEMMSTGVATVSAGYFDTLRIALRSGRDFRESDDTRSSQVAVINEEVAHRWFPGRDPLGLKLTVSGREWTVIGVVATGRYDSLGESPRPFVYFGQDQMRDRDLTLVVRHRGDTVALASAIERVSVRMDSTVRPFASMTYENFVSAAFVVPRMAAILLSLLGVLALVLAVLGIYGVMAQNVSARTRELGIRMALGSPRDEVLRLILFHGLRLIVAGLLIGAVTAFGVSRVLSGVLVGVTSMDAWTWLLTPLLLLVAALGACLVPALRAARVDPMVALRAE